MSIRVYKFMVTVYLLIFLPLYSIFLWKNNMNMCIGSLSYLAAGITRELWLFDLQWEWGKLYVMDWMFDTNVYLLQMCLITVESYIVFKKQTSKQKKLESSSPTKVKIRLQEYLRIVDVSHIQSLTASSVPSNFLNLEVIST